MDTNKSSETAIISREDLRFLLALAYRGNLSMVEGEKVDAVARTITAD